MKTTTTKMREVPILLSGPMVRATWDGRKTQTRQLLTIENARPHPGARLLRWENNDAESLLLRYKPPCRVGDRLWVKEAWRVGAWKEDGGLIAVDYLADGYCRREWLTIPDDDDGAKFNTLWIESTDDARKALGDRERYEWEPGKSPCRWRAARCMPKWAARPDRLEVTDVRVQRVQEISESDAIAEGFDYRLAAHFLDAAAGKIEAQNSNYIRYADGSESDGYLCYACAKKEAGPNDTIVGDCGCAPESDGPASCDKCNTPLWLALTEYGVGRELFLEDDPTGTMSRKYWAYRGGDARIAQTFADGIGDLREHHLRRLAAIGFATAWNVSYGPGVWERNDWVWVICFKRIDEKDRAV